MRLKPRGSDGETVDGSSAPMQPISGLSVSAAQSRMDDALLPLLDASPRSGPPGSPNISPPAPRRASIKKRVVQKPDGRYLIYYEKKTT